jgi:NAD dependent epimerase/dehydratase family enzyme
MDDIVGIYTFSLENNFLTGPVNACSPHSVRNREFTITLAAALRRPAVFNVPKFLIKMALGELGQEIMASQKVNPQKIANSGYKFRFPDLKEALKNVLT